MFQKIQKLIQKFKEKGQGVIEYALVLGVVAVIAVYLIGRGNLQNRAETALDNIDSAASIITDKMANASSTSTG